MTKLIPIVIAVALVVGGGSFYGGMKYAQSNSSAGRQGGFANLSPEERQARLQQFGQASGSRGMRTMGGSGSTAGEVLAKDDKSIIVKLRDGGSKIIFFAENTSVMKSVSGIIQDLKVGEQITVNGTANQDGSISAASIQIRPTMPNGN
jgi:pectate lyase